MNFKVAARLAGRELRGGLAGFRILLGCIILGVAAIAAVGTIRASIEAGLSEKGAELLGGDAEIGLTYRFATEDERAWMDAQADTVSEVVDFRSMAVVRDERALTQVKAVDGAYPLLGDVGLDPAMPLGAALDGEGELPGAVMAPALIARLALEPGDVVRLGTQDFVLMAALVDEPDGAAAGFALGPRTLVRTTALQASGLLQEGTLFSTDYRLNLPEGADLAALKSEAEEALGTSGIEWRDAREGAPGISEFVNRLGAFLVLVGLSGLAVGGVGISSAVRAYLARKTATIATLRTLGADRGTVMATYFLQIGALGGLGLVLGILLGAGVPVALSPIIEARLPVPAQFAFYARPMAEAAIYGALAVLIFTIAPLSRIEEIRAASLFRDGGSDGRRLPRWPMLAVIGALTALLMLAAAAFSGDLRLTLWTAGGILGALTLLWLAAWGVQALARLARPLGRGRPAVGWALAAIGGPRSTAAPTMLALGLGLTVLAAVGQIDGTLRGAITGNLPDRAPSFFFVDLQADQMEGFRDLTEADPDVSRVDSAPMLRGMITAINGRDPSEVSESHWVLDGDRGLSYAAASPDPVTKGTFWPEDYNGPPQISFAEEEAMELGLDLGDEITVNILGRDITAPITSLREVDFSTAGIGFIMVMNPGALMGAPHSVIATVYADAGAEARLLREVSNTYPNVTGIPVKEAIDRVAELLKGLAAATSWGASATLLTGFLVLIGAAAADQNARVFEAAVLKTLGASRTRILASLALRAILLGAAAGAVALGAGALGGWAVSHFVMEVEYRILWPSALIIIGAGVLVTLLTALAFALRPLGARPAQVLRARE
ncbi:putative ABC transport system permease protein [Roseovarius nanhaiticus]|uniref:Putative ABC transport system permease protein n=1 Tax=Roseovarius nanhaiticus TaxID=573024 RepID=A0A1N7FKB3_9RHOB|nr:FtsX-like permease family protein [Roseovarius nanhaiticus]SEK52310.1 putative ABC transport system permease protein [Roseovarius nanhaiticus]SIS00858.1 putative ABC transport system permease protein [Roseovarius nanhaiticus]